MLAYVKVIVGIIVGCQVVIAQSFKALNYDAVLNKWKTYTDTDPKLIRWNIQNEMKNYSLPHNQCLRPCEYPVFEYTAQGYNSLNDPTVFVVAGFHGDEKLGPWILTYAYPYLKGKHLIMMPIANPSGFVYGTREEQPSRIDPNRDFPFESNEKTCMLGVTSRIIDYIYRRWKIDLTLTIHQGGEEIGWNWGSPQKQGYLAEDQLIYKTIGESLKRRGGNNSMYDMRSLNAGNMNSVIYAAGGTFEDWAYAASWLKSIGSISKCNAFNYEPYPQDMTTGLVYIIESAKQKYLQERFLGSEQGVSQAPTSRTPENGFVARGIRILQESLQIAYPQIKYAKQLDSLVFSVLGCDNVKLSLIVNNKVYKYNLKGSMSLQFNQTYFDLKLADPNQTGNIQLEYQAVCDKQWLGLGKSRFGRGRIYRGQLNLTLQQLETYNSTTKQQQSQKDQSIFVILIWGICGLLLIGIAIVTWKVYTRKINNLIKQESERPSEVAISGDMPTDNSLHNIPQTID